MPGRPKGSKNRAGHNAGGARAGAGRKRKDGQDTSLAISETAMKALKRLTGQDFHDVSTLEITTQDGEMVSVDISGMVSKNDEGTPTEAAPRGTAKILAVPNSLTTPDYHDSDAGDGFRESSADGQPSTSQIPIGGSMNSRGIVVPEDGKMPGPDMQDLIKLFNNSADPAATARLSLILDPHVSHSAIQRALMEGSSIPEALLPLENAKPSLVTGPFMVMPVTNPDGSRGDPASDLPPTLAGPMDSAFLPTQHCTAVYYVVYEKKVSAASHQAKPKSSGPRTGPGVPVAGPSLQAAKSGEVEIAPWGNVDLTDRKRAPRRCVICGAYECKGRGGRIYCPHYDPNNIEHTTVGPGGRKRKREDDVEVPSYPSPDSAVLDFLPAEYANFGVHPSLLAELQQRQRTAGLDGEASIQHIGRDDDQRQDDVQIDPALDS